MLNFLPATDLAVVDIEGLYLECLEQAAAVHEVEGTHKSAELYKVETREAVRIEIPQEEWESRWLTQYRNWWGKVVK